MTLNHGFDLSPKPSAAAPAALPYFPTHRGSAAEGRPMKLLISALLRPERETSCCSGKDSCQRTMLLCCLYLLYTLALIIHPIITSSASSQTISLQEPRGSLSVTRLQLSEGRSAFFFLLFVAYFPSSCDGPLLEKSQKKNFSLSIRTSA